ncbi:MAG: M1 family aminopeptidase, partial [Actinomycetota bacterium]
DGRQIPVTHLVPRGELDRFGPAIDTVDERLRFFEDRFGPYPLAGHGLAFVEGFNGGAMETQGRSMFPADLAWEDPDDVLTELLLAHELAHQWFGNAVSPGDWGDIWLNESFATYVQWMWFDEIGIQPIEEPARLNLASRQAPGAPTGAPGVDGMFGYTVYDGGAPVVHALRLIVGDDVFFEILQTWIDVYAIGSASTADFIAVAEEVSGEELSSFFDLWLYSATLPDEYPS